MALIDPQEEMKRQLRQRYAISGPFGGDMPPVEGLIAPSPEERAQEESLLGRVGRGFNRLMDDPRRMAGLGGIAQGLLQAGAVSSRPISNAEAMAMASQGASGRLQQYDQGRRQDHALGLKQAQMIQEQRAAQREAQNKAEGENFDWEYKLRNKFRKENEDLFKMSEAAQRLVSSAQNPSPAGDLAMVFNFMKMQDPNSVVRESEFDTAAKAKAALSRAEGEGEYVPAFVRGAINRLTKGEILLPEQRRDFVSTAKNVYEGQREILKSRAKQFTDLASRYDLSPENVTMLDEPLDFSSVLGDSGRGGGPSPSAGPSGGPRPGAVEDGYRFKGGDPANPQNWEPMNG